MGGEVEWVDRENVWRGRWVDRENVWRGIVREDLEWVER